MIDGASHDLHRIAWLYVKGEWPVDEIDHKDRDKQNNKWLNLRPATRKQNLENVGVRAHSKSQIKGVYFDPKRKKWCAYIDHEKRRRHLGRFVEAADAQAARVAAEKIFFTHAPTC